LWPSLLSSPLASFLVVGDEIVQGEAVVGRDKVDACPGAAAAMIVEISGTEKAFRSSG
jgi:hypothetical protein